MKINHLISSLLLLLLFASCGNNDDSDAEYDVEVRPNNLKGVWYNKETIIDGVTIPYVNACPSQRDNLHIKSNFSTDIHIYDSSCIDTGFFDMFTSTGTHISNPYASIEFHELGYFEFYRITKLTNKSMHLKYEITLPDNSTEIGTKVYTKG